VSGLNPDIDRGNLSHGWVPFEGVEILGFGPLALAKDEKRFPRLGRVGYLQ